MTAPTKPMGACWGPCPNCKKSRAWAGAQHRCPPSWEVAEASVRDDEDERSKVYADTAGEAAEEFARLWWEDEGPSDGDSLDVAVFIDGEARPFEVTAYWSVDYGVRKSSRWPS